MKVQRINTSKGKRYIVIDDNLLPISEINRYLHHLDNLGKSPNTQKSYAFNLMLFCQYMSYVKIGIKDLCACPDKGPIVILSEFVLWLQYPDYSKNILHIEKESCARSNRTINHVMSVVLGFYQYLAMNDEIEQLEAYRLQLSSNQFKPFLYELVKHKTKIMSSIFKKQVPSVPVEAITRQEFNTLFNLCSSRRNKLLLSLLFEGGLRLNEALGMRISDVAHLEDKIINIVARENNENGARVKGNSEGCIYLPDYVVDLILDYINEDILEYESDFLFLNLVGRYKGKPLRDNNIEQFFIRLSLRAGFRVRPHMLRHGFAQEKLEAGWPLEQVQAYLRHKNPTSTLIYAQYTDVMKIEQMQKFINVMNNKNGDIKNDR